MPGFVLNTAATVLCPHGGQVQIIPSSPRVQLSGQPVATLGDSYVVAGCAFVLPNGKPQPCVRVQWLMGATRVQAGGPVILQSSVGLCLSAEGIPNGPANVVVVQSRVRGL